MPRVTDQEHIARYRALHRVWLEHQGWFRYASAQSQWYLHDYYQPSLELTDEQVLAHRRDVRELRPALAQQAGRAYVGLLVGMFEGVHELGALTTVVSARGKRKPRRVCVSAVIRPMPDPEVIARAVVEAVLNPRDAA